MPLKIKKMFTNHKGFTLIGVLAILALLALLTTTLLSAFVTTGQWNYKARQKLIATNYANAVLEDLRVEWKSSELKIYKSDGTDVTATVKQDVKDEKSVHIDIDDISTSYSSSIANHMSLNYVEIPPGMDAVITANGEDEMLHLKVKVDYDAGGGRRVLTCLSIVDDGL